MFFQNILNTRKTAQALTELTLFGSFFIMLLAVMVSYSMRYNSQQRVTQEAFRKGISKLHHYASPHDADERSRVEFYSDDHEIDASGTSSLTYIRYRDDYVPDPSSPFGLGSVESSVSSATLTRDMRMHMTAGLDYELPQIAIDIDGINKVGEDGNIACNSHLNKKYRDSSDKNLKEKYGSEEAPCYYLTAGFRVDDGVKKDENTFTRYAQIYGEGSLEGCSRTYDRENNECDNGNGDANKNDGWVPLYEWDDDDGEWDVNGDLPNSFALRMIDNSGGEIMEYGAAVSQCRRIVDDDVCKDECNEGKSSDSDTDCNAICGSDVKVPWYCKKKDEIDTNTHRYKFPVLDRLFGINTDAWDYENDGNPTPLQTMGVQTNYDQQSEKDGTASYSSEEDSDTIKNSVKLSSGWSDTVKRRVIFVPYKSNRNSVDEDEDDEDDLRIKDIDNQKTPDISSFTWETAR